VLKDSQARVAAVKSAQLWELLRFTLQQSDNTYAELFGRLVALRTGAQNSPEGAVSAVLKSLKDNGVSTKGLHLSDCSGLSDKSKLTASALIQVQEKYMSSLDASALEGMGVSGFSGTALERAFTPKVRGLIRLKTGSLSEVTSMTGNVVRTKGGVVFFAVIVNKPENMWSAHVAVDSFVSKLADL
ncbi:MAG: D-alanyl-D-alanine carboxypeptidase, partial [Bifidobacteriaceae bacterium]|nr:D-alanyl-D-alanine carboxypeptidase [Bifidobacteriaceae bacterium]